jgi:hypothetical protein
MSVSFRYGACYACTANRQLPERANAVVSVALAVKGSRYGVQLIAYKSARDVRVREQTADLLATVLERWLSGHEQCLATKARAAHGFDVVTVVPSRRGRPVHPLSLIAGELAACADRYQDLLSVPGDTAGFPAHTPEPDLFRSRPITPVSTVLLVDDMWTTGASAQSAACALKLAGASSVGVLTLGRHVDPAGRYPAKALTERYLTDAATQGWDWSRCRLCTPLAQREAAAPAA